MLSFAGSNARRIAPVDHERQPRAADEVPYAIVNHCRWDHVRDVVPALLLKRSLRSFVLRAFAEKRVVPEPLLYRLMQEKR